MANVTSAVITGRSMKMRERFMSKRLRVYLTGRNRFDVRAGEEPQLAIGDDRLSGIHATLDNDSASERCPHRDDSRFHALVGLDHINELPLLRGLHRLTWNDYGILSCVESQGHVHEL